MVGMALAACSSRDSTGGDSGRVPPQAEFLFAAGDSTYWIRSSAEGLRVRSAPILLTQVDGTFYEVFIAEDGVEYEDASFSSSRIWSRQLTGTDSLLLFNDSTVMSEAAQWKKRHPTEQPIDIDDEDLPSDPGTVVHDEIEIVDVHGPWLTFRHLLDVDVVDGAPHRHVGRRAVVDVRTGKIVSLDTLIGASEAARVAMQGQTALTELLDSIETAGDERAELARETLAGFRFDASSFGITDVDREPAVAFLVPGTGSDGEALAIYLPPMVVTAPAWWSAVRSTLPEWTADSSRVSWTRATYEVAARPSSDGESLALVLAGRSRNNTSEWPVATVAAPAYQLIVLDDPPVPTALRAALSRAFDASSALDGLMQRASYLPRAKSARVRRGRRSLRQ